MDFLESRVAISRQDWSFRRRGPQDEARHNAKVKDAIKDNLPTIISDGNIITADPTTKKIVRVPLKGLELPHIRYKKGEGGVGTGKGGEEIGDIIGIIPGEGGSGKNAGDQPGVEYYETEFTIEELGEMVFADLGLPALRPRKKEQLSSEVIVFDDVRKHRSPSNLDLQRTIYRNIERNALEKGRAEIGDIRDYDFMRRTWRESTKEENAAVVMVMADVSGSMGDFEKYITRAFSFWTVAFLRSKYPKVDIVFVAHDTEAQEVTEEQFFSRGTGGGTKISSANKLALNVIDSRYSPNLYNIYPLHFSDGENWSDNNSECVRLVEEMLDGKVNQYVYVQIGSNDSSGLMADYKREILNERFKGVVISKKEDVWPALKYAFPQDAA